MQKPARPTRVHNESGAEPNFFPFAPAINLRAFTADYNALHLRLIEIFNAETLRFANEEMVEVRAIPVRVGNLVAWTGGDQELVTVIGMVVKRPVKLVMIKREPALQTAGDLRIRFLPTAPLG